MTMMTMRRLIQLLPATLLLGGWLQFAAAQDMVEPSDMVRGGLQAIQLVDQNKPGELWDGASPITRKRVTRSDFANQVAKTRAPLGAAQQRNWVAINRQVLTEGDPDLAGQYVSVEYESRFANDQAVKRELVTFHLDSDKVWRFSGYVLR